MRACLITNSRSGHGTLDLSAALPILLQHGWDVRLRDKQRGGQATAFAREAVQDGFDMVVACAGDGTVREIVDGVVGTRVALGVLPGGTANLWAHELGVSSRLRDAATQLVTSVRRYADVGSATANDRIAQHFLLMAGLGYDGAVMARVSKPLKRRIGVLAIALAGLREMAEFRPVPVRVERDGLSWEGRISQAIVGNTRRYGGFTRITPDAFIDDGLLDLCLFRGTNPVVAAGQVASLLLRQRPGRVGAHLSRTASVTIEARSVVPLQLDGGRVKLKKVKPRSGLVTYRFSTIPHGVVVLVPRDYSGSLFQHDDVAEAPVATGHVHEGDDGMTGGDRGGAAERHARRLFRVVTVEADRISAVQRGSAALVTILIDANTTIGDGKDAAEPLRRPTGRLREGDVVRVKGKCIGDPSTLLAKRLIVIEPRGEAGSSAEAP
jgi:YegS/Rv2252/BmrU family lipid kinase